MDAVNKYLKYANDLITSQAGTVKFKTGGTASEAKCIEKSYESLKKESDDIFKTFGLYEGLEYISTTTPEHVFGFTYHYLLPLLHNSKLNTNRINYPEDLTVGNAVLITTPSFLEVMYKYGTLPKVKPKFIISAGAKLKREVFEYAKTISEKVIDLYGSTETGTIAYRTEPDNDFTLFDGIEIVEHNENGTLISTEYSLHSLQLVGDNIRVNSDRTISLLGRADRILKILDKRISAAEIEDKIRTIKGIRDCYCTVHKDKLAALLVLNSEGQQSVIHNTNLFIKQIKNFLNNYFEIIPQYFKFIDEIPTQINGKIDKKQVRELFEINLSLPLVLSRFCDGDYSHFKLCFLKNSNFFKGHFDGFPILAGVVQLFYANFFIKQAFGIDCRQGQIRKIKFSNIIKPDTIVTLTLEKNRQSIIYKYQDDDTVFSSGVMPLKSLLEN